MALSRDKVLKHAGSFERVEVHVPAWADENGDDVVIVRGMTVREYELNQANAKPGQATAMIITKCVLDDSGSTLFTKDDVRLISELPLSQIEIVSKAIFKASGFEDAKTDGEGSGEDEDDQPVHPVAAAIDSAGNDSGLTTSPQPSVEPSFA